MCGIVGVLERDAERLPCVRQLQRMAAALAHRGPDAERYFVSGRVGLAHRRLSIIDLESGQQPMQDPDGQVSLVFNGEIYNYPELKRELEQEGYRFRTRSDTEVLLALYLRKGLAAFPRLNGMFACAFWDSRTRQLVLARDRLGKKPLFYHDGPDRFLFASELKALLTHGGLAPRVNSSALQAYLCHGYLTGRETILAGVHRLPPAHVLVVGDRGSACHAYWQLEFRPAATPPLEAEVAERLSGLLQTAVERRLMSDVPLGAFLSGGLDSSTVVALMARASRQPVRTFTIGFQDADYSELEDARVVARHLQTDHHEIMVKPASLDILPQVVWHLDEPFADSSAVPTYCVCRAAREHVTVALSGDGGDEVFAGYTRYRQLDGYRRMAAIPAALRRSLGLPAAWLPFTWPGWNHLYALGALRDGGVPVGLGIYPYIREKLYTPEFRRLLRGAEDPFDSEVRLLHQVAHLDPVSRYQYLDTLHYLPGDILTKVDRMSMANSLEVRSPLLDYTVVEYLASLPACLKLRDGVSKYVLREYCRGLLPPTTLAKRKQGFAIPKRRWFQGDLKAVAHEVLLDRRALARGYFRKAAVERLLRHHAAGRRDYSDWIWALLILETWFRLFLDARPASR
jgi:asparagine synthase (glutamine-hydrolysing)